MASFSITPLTDHTGVEVTGLDFTQPVEAEKRIVLNRAFAEHHVLVMRDQHFAPQEFKAAVQLFGEIQPHDKQERHVPGHPGLDYVSNDDIENGRLRPGAKLPNEIELSTMYGVARLTVRRAIADLVEHDYLVVVRGRGTYVRQGDS